MESRFKMRISRMFRSSFGSCNSKNISDVIHNKKPVFSIHKPTQNQSKTELKSLHSWPETSQTQQQIKNLFPRIKISDKKTLLFTSGSVQENCSIKFNPMNRVHTKKTKNKKKKSSKIKRFDFYEYPTSYYYSTMFSSDGDDEESDETTSFFSSRSLSIISSDSSESFRRPRKALPRRRTAAVAKTKKEEEEEGGGGVTVKGSVAVVKKSSDPYSDFRASMLEMIMENQIFTMKDLEKLLECFLCLNSQNHHGVIIEVFTEICETLFSNCS